MAIPGGAGSVGYPNGNVTLFRERLQQAHDIARERSTSPKRWCACRKLYRLTIIDAVGYGVDAATGNGRSRDHQLGAAAAAADGELHRGAIGAAARKRGGGD